MFAAGFGLVIMAPAYYLYENAPWWTVPLSMVYKRMMVRTTTDPVPSHRC
jgi:hypothetical protein